MWIDKVLELLRIVVSWPIAAVVIALVFKDEIRRLLDRVKSISVPGAQIQTVQQPERGPAENQVNPPPATLPAGLTLDAQQQEILRQAFQAERATARLWEYRYLNFFLARTSQVVLDWLSGLGAATTYDAYDTYWLPIITDASQRRIIIDVLQAHQLIVLDGLIIAVSEKGREYIGWRGQLPPLPAATPGGGS